MSNLLDFVKCWSLEGRCLGEGLTGSHTNIAVFITMSRLL